MERSHLKATLRSLVLEHGFEQVEQCLHEIDNADLQLELRQRNEEPLTGMATSQSNKRRAKLTAPEYVAKMDLPLERQSLISELATRFHDKSFLPAFGDIANFCHAHEIDVPASKTRINAIPRVFKYLAGMEDEEIHRIINDGMFSGPSRLGPIAEAIRRNGRANSVVTANAKKH